MNIIDRYIEEENKRASKNYSSSLCYVYKGKTLKDILPYADTFKKIFH